MVKKNLAFFILINLIYACGTPGENAVKNELQDEVTSINISSREKDNTDTVSDSPDEELMTMGETEPEKEYPGGEDRY